MLSKEQRFSTSDFLLIKTLKPEKIPTSIGVFCIYKNSEKVLGNKFAIVLAKKNFKLAVTRNKYKRLFFNFLKENNKNNNLKYSIVFYPKKQFTKEELLHAIMSFK